MLDNLKAEAQQALAELWSENLIPFELTARQVNSEDSEEYTVRFFDSRLHSVNVRWKVGQSFKDLVRVAVLARVPKQGVGH